MPWFPFAKQLSLVSERGEEMQALLLAEAGRQLPVFVSSQLLSAQNIPYSKVTCCDPFTANTNMSKL